MCKSPRVFCRRRPWRTTRHRDCSRFVLDGQPLVAHPRPSTHARGQFHAAEFDGPDADSPASVPPSLAGVSQPRRPISASEPSPPSPPSVAPISVQYRVRTLSTPAQNSSRGSKFSSKTHTPWSRPAPPRVSGRTGQWQIPADAAIYVRLRGRAVLPVASCSAVPNALFAFFLSVAAATIKQPNPTLIFFLSLSRACRDVFWDGDPRSGARESGGSV